MELTAICNDLLELPELIRCQSEEVMSLTDAVDSLKSLVELLREKSLSEMLELEASADKKMYPNQQACDLALHDKLNKDESYQKKVRELKNAEWNLKKANISLQYFRDQFSAYRAILYSNRED